MAMLASIFIFLFLLDSSLSLTECDKDFDLVFVIDGSGSIFHAGAENWDLIKNFVKDVTAEFRIGYNRTRVAAMVFSEKRYNNVEFSLGTYYTKEEILRAIGNMFLPTGGTYTAEALKKVNKKIFTSSQDRKDMPNVVIVITDGKAADADQLGPAAADLRNNKDASIIAIGVGKDYDRGELVRMAGELRNVFTADFADLKNVPIDQIKASACAEFKCGGTLTNPTGEITSPNYPNNYPDDITCTWKISPGKTHVNVTIEDFMLEDSKGCKEFDFVKIKVKSGRYSTEEVVICGSLPSRELNLKVDGTSVEITFTSDKDINARGFKISYKSYDIDPCLTNNGGCSHNCSLVKGIRTCSCPAGKKLIYDGRTCKDEKSCHFVGRQKCPYSSKSSCKDLPNGDTTCECWRGYKKQNGRTCQDYDECAEIPGRCGVGVCHNRRGYFYCSCPKGYRNWWQSGGETCKDYDECTSYRPPNCGNNAVCVNTPGSYICQCEPGFKFNDTLKTCQDDDECAVGNSGCDHVCSNTNGSFSCSCHPGYFLDSDGKTCRAVKVESLGRVHKTKACYGESLGMSCQDPVNTLVIFKASYAGDSQVCPNKPEKPLPLRQIFEGKDSTETLSCKEDVTDKIKMRCGWRQKCDVTVNDVIGGRCGPGPTRYLSVTYSCGKPLQCSPLPRSDSCAAPVKDECKADKECQNSQMCCFDGCKRACLEPVPYTSGL